MRMIFGGHRSQAINISRRDTRTRACPNAQRDESIERSYRVYVASLQQNKQTEQNGISETGADGDGTGLMLV